MRQIASRYAEAGIRDFEHGPAVLRMNCGNDRPALWRVLDRIVQQIYHNLFESGGISFYLYRLGSIAIQRNVFLLGEQTHLVGGCANQFSEV
jgi:hypothetical protein